MPLQEGMIVMLNAGGAFSEVRKVSIIPKESLDRCRWYGELLAVQAERGCSLLILKEGVDVRILVNQLLVITAGQIPVLQEERIQSLGELEQPSILCCRRFWYDDGRLRFLGSLFRLVAPVGKYAVEEGHD